MSPENGKHNEEEVVIYDQVGAILRLTMNRPRFRNAQSTALIAALDAAFNRAVEDETVKVIILAGAGVSFSSGHDLGTEEERRDPRSFFKGKGVEDLHLRSWRLFLDTTLRWRDLPKPTIAQVQGHCIMAGYMIAAAMDMIVAADDARFLPALTQFFSLPWDIGVRKAKEILFQARFVDANEAERLGLVNYVVPRETLERQTMALATRIASNDPLQLRMLKFATNQAQDAMGYRSAIRDAHSHHFISRVGAYFESGFALGERLVRKDPGAERALAAETGKGSGHD